MASAALLLALLLVAVLALEFLLTSVLALIGLVFAYALVVFVSFTVDAVTPLAATVGYRRETTTIVLSAGLLRALEDRERSAAIAHELAHVANRDVAMLTVLSVPALRAATTMERHSASPVAMIPAFVARAASRFCVALVSRTREYAADDGAVAITGDPAALASALETLDTTVERRPRSDLREHDLAGAFSIVPLPWDEQRFFDRTRRFVSRRLFGTHPPTKKRIERLRSRV